MQAERAAHAHDLMEVLASLWGALDIAEDAPERTTFGRIMSGPQRLHSKSLEKVRTQLRAGRAQFRVAPVKLAYRYSSCRLSC